MKIRSFSTIVLILCFALLLISLVSCKEKEPELEENNTEYLFNPFDEINVVKDIKVTEISTQDGGYVTNQVKNISDINRFLRMLKNCKFYEENGEDTKKAGSVEISHFVDMSEISFFVSKDKTHIYLSETEDVDILQRDVVSYRVENFGEMDWLRLLSLRDATMGILGQLEQSIGFDFLIETEPSQRHGEVREDELLNEFCNLLGSCTKAEAEVQSEEIYEYYFSVLGYNFKLSGDLGGYRYMCEVNEEQISDAPIKLENRKTFRVEGIGEDFILKLKSQRKPSFFRSVRYMDVEGAEEDFRIWTNNKVYYLKDDEVYRILSLLERCEYDDERNYTAGDIESRGYYFDMKTLYYDFYISANGRSLVFCSNSTDFIDPSESFCYTVEGFDMKSFLEMLETFDFAQNISFAFWKMKDIYTEVIVD